jgi:hypothetical protein
MQEREPRLVALLGALFSTYVILAVALSTLGLTAGDRYNEGVDELCTYLMFYSLVAAVARGGPGWLIAQGVVWFIWTMILQARDPIYLLGAGELTPLMVPGRPVWEQDLFHFYWTVGACLRIGALAACESRLAHTPQSRWMFRLFILLHVALWLAIFAVPHVGAIAGVDSEYLLCV